MLSRTTAGEVAMSHTYTATGQYATTTDAILPFKWEDWCRSVGLDYRPTSVPAFCKPKPGTLSPIVNAAKEVQAALTLS